MGLTVTEAPHRRLCMVTEDSGKIENLLKEVEQRVAYRWTIEGVYGILVGGVIVTHVLLSSRG